MKKKLMNNLFLKIISVVIAVLVWLGIANINDPIVTKSYIVPVTIQNSAYIESSGKTYRVEEEQLSTTVILRGHSSLVERRANDIEAVADLTQIVDMDTKPYVMVPINVTCDKIPLENITVVPRNMQIVIEEVESKDFIVTVNKGETSPDPAFEIGSIESNPEKITLSGPQSLIRKIDRVVANVDVTGIAINTMKTSRLKIYDKNQDELSETQMSYLKFDIGEPTVDVNIDLWKVHTDVKIKVNYSGTPGPDYLVDDVSITPTTIGIAGTDEALQILAQNNNTIEIPEDVVVLSGQTEDFETKIDLASYLPENTMLLASDVKSAIVHVSIIPVGSKQFSIPTKNITVENLDDSLRVVYDMDKLTARVKGEADPLTMVNENTVLPVIDLAGKGKGDYTVPVSLILPEGCELLEEITVMVHLAELE